jgi:hypothetical protein
MGARPAARHAKFMRLAVWQRPLPGGVIAATAPGLM